jgi:branched-chain amino acid transport system ATP-binding protein
MPPDSGPGSLAGVAGVLEAREISVRFGGVQALQDVSIPVETGLVSGLIGPNGAGKTTLFDVLTGLRRPDAGRVMLAGRDITRLGTHRRARLGMARTFQRLELFWSLSVEDNVMVGAEATAHWWSINYQMRSRRHRGEVTNSNASDVAAAFTSAVGKARVSELLEKVGLADVASLQVGSLPTGQARLVELARALATGPRVLLLDEPSSGLDDSESAALGSLLVDLAKAGMAVLLVEHDMDLLMSVSDRVTVLDTGTVIASGKPAEIRQNPAVRAAYLGDTDVALSEVSVDQPSPSGPATSR